MNNHDAEARAKHELELLRAEGALPGVDHLVSNHVAAMVELGDQLESNNQKIVSATPRARGIRIRAHRRFATVMLAAIGVLVGTGGLAFANVLPDPIQRTVEKVTGIVGIEPQHEADARKAERQIDAINHGAKEPTSRTSPRAQSKSGNDVRESCTITTATSSASGSCTVTSSKDSAKSEPSGDSPEPDPASIADESTVTEPAPIFTRQKVAWSLKKILNSGMTLRVNYNSVGAPCFRRGQVRIREGTQRVFVSVFQRINTECTAAPKVRTLDIQLPANLGSRKLIDTFTGLPIERTFSREQIAWDFVSVTNDDMSVTVSYSSQVDACFRRGNVGLREGTNRVTILVHQRIDLACFGDMLTRTATVQLTSPLGDRKLVDGSTGLVVSRSGFSDSTTSQTPPVSEVTG